VILTVYLSFLLLLLSAILAFYNRSEYAPYPRNDHNKSLAYRCDVDVDRLAANVRVDRSYDKPTHYLHYDKPTHYLH